MQNVGFQTNAGEQCQVSTGEILHAAGAPQVFGAYQSQYRVHVAPQHREETRDRTFAARILVMRVTPFVPVPRFIDPERRRKSDGGVVQCNLGFLLGAPKT